jgi:peptidoglycan/LPS O-acetylase OafA/YrhL
MTQRYLGLDYLRALLITRVVAVHSVMAYADLGGLIPAAQLHVVDPQQWRGFLYFLVLNDIYGMPLLFFISGLFVWPGLTRRGALGYGLARARRLGIPFVVATATVIPLAFYPAFRANGVDLDPVSYAEMLISGRGWAPEPLWFIWLLLAFDLCAAAIYRLAPSAFETLGRFAAGAARRPARFYFIFIAAAAVAYLPMLLAFGPAAWAWAGPLALQPSRLLYYALYFFAGVGVGARGLALGPLGETSQLVRKWARWVVLAGLLLLIHATVLFPLLGALAAVSLLLAATAYALAFVAASAATAFALLALFQRFLTRRIRPADSLAANSYGIYLVHSVVVLWSQYLLLSVALPPQLKAAMVFVAALSLSWLGTSIARHASNALRPRRPDSRGRGVHPIPERLERGERSQG